MHAHHPVFTADADRPAQESEEPDAPKLAEWFWIPGAGANAKGVSKLPQERSTTAFTPLMAGYLLRPKPPPEVGCTALHGRRTRAACMPDHLRGVLPLGLARLAGLPAELCSSHGGRMLRMFMFP
jgi:hypothetical protein